MKSAVLPIFYDKSGIRWKISLVIFFLCVSLLGVIIGYTVVNVLESGQLPKKLIPETVVAMAEPVVDPKAYEQLKLDINIPTSPSVFENITTNKNMDVVAFYVNWDEKSFLSLKRNINTLTKISPEWLHLKNSLGEVTLDNRTRQIETVKYIKANKPSLKIIPIINNYNVEKGMWDNAVLSQVLVNPATQKALIANLLSYVKDNGFDGITIDFENYAQELNTYLYQFMGNLHTAFAAENLQVMHAVPILEPGLIYEQVAANADYVVLMSYDQNFPTSLPGPISAHSWYYTNLVQRIKQIPAEKLVIALGNYGYNWETGQAEALEITYQDALQISKDFKTPINYDAYNLNPNFTYSDDKNAVHNVWFLDAVTLYNQVISTRAFSPAGYALWRLGSEDPSVWNILSNINKPATELTEQLKSIGEGYDLKALGTGEIITSLTYSQKGQREITVDPTTGLVYGEKVTQYNTPNQITYTGKSNLKQIALTFDDGPDPIYTEQILDVLKENKVKATFFVTGTNVSLYPNILKRIYQEGHEIGSHTLTHPNISMITDDQLKIELNSTQAVISANIGAKTTLFRPPYGEDEVPQTPEEINKLKTVLDLGYNVVLMGVDPNDWMSPEPNKIVSAVSEQIEAGKGNIVLLHDSGGVRAQTVVALPTLIKRLKDRGYELVPVSTLLQTSRDGVMPKTQVSQSQAEALGGVGFSLFAYLYKSFRVIFFLGTLLGIYRLVMIITFAIIQKIKKNNVKVAKKAAPVSVLIPAYNEEKVIVKSIKNVLNNGYKNCEIIVIDDGSKDKTYEIAKKAFEKNDRVKVLQTPQNMGKSSALNFGIEHAKNEIIIIQDADSLMSKGAISAIAKHFINPKVGAVSGNVRVGNRVNFLTNLQALEYISSQNLDRRAFELYNGITVVPGAVGAWRKSALIKVGGFNSRTLAEDAEITLRIIGNGYKVVYEDTAIAYTEAPQDVKSFLKQRFRWMFGTLQSLVLHKGMIFNPNYGFLGLFSLPNVLIFHLIMSLLGPFIDLYFFSSLIFNLLQKYYHPTFPLTTLYINIMAYLLFLLVDLLVQFVAFILEGNRDYKLILLLPLQRIFYRQLLYFVTIKTAIIAIKGSMVGWNKLARKGMLAIRE